jgi:ELWxxDGT repeat protein
MRTMQRFRITRLEIYLCWPSLLVGTLLLLVPAPGAHVGAAGPAFLVKDINPGSEDALGLHNMYPWAAARGRLFFTADDGVHGEELWTSDGTADGTALLADIRAEGYSSILFLTNVNDVIFFAADDGVHGYELWKSDGTVAGTAMVADIFPGGRASYPEFLTNANGTLFFRASDLVGWGLWKSDGTAAGTVLVKRHPFPINAVTNVNGSIFYISHGSQGGDFNELWHSDGTVAGTTLVKSFATGGSLNSLTAMNNLLFFFGYTTGRGYELWKSDGTAPGTLLVSDTGPNQSAPGSTLQQVGDTLFILIYETDQRTTLWKTDGTAPGTLQVKDFRPGTTAYYASSGLVANANGTLVFGFYGPDQPPGHLTGALWKSDGTSAGTVPIKEQIMPTGSAVVCGKVFFSASRHVSGSTTPPIDAELWQSDGTSAGTFKVQDIAPGEAGSHPNFMTGVGNKLFFGAKENENGRELWMLPIERTSPAEPTPSIPLPHQIFLPHAQVEASC